ncbi:MAG: UDP-N-acetylmuramoyl-tripeptide--D-alanyl-D-alanine ligase [Oscillatoriales cyanobacterium]|nr:MAG: UDP-N-acetylmuramoyl-tripeptide--D-alanyl-D-alanine ligase [Oscillatoriales cyanobacterium]
MRTIAPFSLRELAAITGATIANLDDHTLEQPIAQISTDSRAIGTGTGGEIFVALRGETFDGRAFVPGAIAAGATAALVDQPLAEPLPQLVVANPLAAYQAIAQAWRDRAAIPVVGVTGSAGKTTTKELIAAVLSTAGNVHKTYANYNNEIGVPKTLLQITGEHDFAVVEMAMRGRGQIAELAQIARPNVGLITNVGTAHIGLLGSEQAIAEAKCELLVEMPSDSVAVLNGDCDRLMATAQDLWRGETMSYGFNNGNFRGELLDGQTLLVEGRIFPLPLAGRHNALNFLGALAVAKVLGLDWEPIAAGLAVQLPDGRARRYELPNGAIVLDETYNAGLESMTAALVMLAETPGTRRLAVLGTMKELGDRAPEFHAQVGNLARDLQLDGLWVLADDPTALHIAEGAKGLPCEVFETHEALIDRLPGALRSGDVCLLKASRSVGLDRVVQALVPTQRDRPHQGHN